LKTKNGGGRCAQKAKPWVVVDRRYHKNAKESSEKEPNKRLMADVNKNTVHEEEIPSNSGAPLDPSSNPHVPQKKKKKKKNAPLSENQGRKAASKKIKGTTTEKKKKK